MPRTYNPLSNVTVGSVLTASDYNEAVENSNNFRVPPMCKAVRAAAASVANSTFVPQALSAADEYDTDTMHDTVTDNDRVTINTAGVYLVTAKATFAANTTGQRIVAIAKNGSVEDQFSVDAMDTFAHHLAGAQTYSLAVTDYLSVLVFQNSGAPLDVTNVSLSAVWQGQAS